MKPWQVLQSEKNMVLSCFFRNKTHSFYSVTWKFAIEMDMMSSTSKPIDLTGVNSWGNTSILIFSQCVSISAL